MSAVFVRKGIYDAFMANSPEGAIELFHGYTYSGHPLACVAALATLEVYREEELFARAASHEPYWQDAAHSLKDSRNVIDIRNIGLVAGIELQTRDGKPGARGGKVFQRCFDAGLLVRNTADVIALSPPLIISKEQIDQIFDILGKALAEVD
jgi:beta-alanine--pyruvate transaminase